MQMIPDFSSVPQSVGDNTLKQNAIPFDKSRKMRATKILRYLRLMLILFINILIYLKLLKNTVVYKKLFVYKFLVRQLHFCKIYCENDFS